MAVSIPANMSNAAHPSPSNDVSSGSSRRESRPQRRLELVAVPPSEPEPPNADEEQDRLRRQISHDIHHELSTIMMLASLLGTAGDVGPDSRERARQLLGETRWLHQLHHAYEESIVSVDSAVRAAAEPVRIDQLAGEVVAAMQLSTLTRIGFETQEAWAHVDRLAFWRGLRNVVGNAVRAAGVDGRVEVRITTEDGWAVAEVDDNGPGFGAVPAGRASLGLGIVQDLAFKWGGELQIRRGVLGGCCVQLRLPSSLPAPSIAVHDSQEVDGA
jgi:signal transduction histidine kinase